MPNLSAIFSTNAHLKATLQVRLVDDAAKVKELKTWAFDDFESLRQDLVNKHGAYDFAYYCSYDGACNYT